MSVNRYLNVNILPYQSQFVQQKIPWDLLQATAEKKQGKRDALSKDISGLVVKPTGREYGNDLWGKTYELPDYKKSLAASQEYNNDVLEFSKDFANKEASSDSYRRYSELAAKKTELETKNAKYTERAKVYDEYQKMLTTGKVNPGDYRAIQYQIEFDKMRKDEDYVPTIHGVQEEFKNEDFVKTAVGDIKEWASTRMSADAGYFNRAENRNITKDRIVNSLLGAFEINAALQDDIKAEAQMYAYQNGIEDINQKVTMNDGTEGTMLDIVKKHRFESMVQNAEKYIYNESKQIMSTDSNYWKTKEYDDANVATTALNLTDVKSDFEITKETAKKYDNYSKGEKRMVEINGKLAALEKSGISLNNASEYGKLKEEKIQLMNQKASFEGTMHNVTLANIGKLKEIATKDIDLKILEAENKLAAIKKGGNYMAGVTKEEELQAKKDIEILNKNKNSLLSAKTSADIERYIQGTSIQKTYDEAVFDLMKTNEKQQEYSGFIINNKNDIKALHGLLRLSEMDFKGLDGENVSFKGTFEDNAQIGFTPDGQPFVTVVEDRKVLGISSPQTKTVVLDPKNKIVHSMLEKNVQAAKDAYTRSGGTDANAKSVMDRGIISLSSTTPIINNSVNMEQKLGAWQKNVVNSQPNQLNYVTIADEDGDLILVAENDAEGRVTVRTAKNINNNLEYFDPFAGTNRAGQTKFEDIYQAVKLIADGK